MFGHCTRFFAPFNACSYLSDFLALTAHSVNAMLSMQQKALFLLPVLSNSSNDFSMESV